MPTHNIVVTLPSGPRSRRRRRPSPAKPPPKPENAPIPSVTRHYPIPAIHPVLSTHLQNPSIGTHTSPFPSSLPSMHTNTALKTTHSSQDDLTEETWGPVTTSSPLEKTHKKHKHKPKSENKNKDSTRYLKMCPTNGYQPRKGAAEGEGSKLQSAVSGSTEFVTGYKVERLVGGGERRTWVTWTRVVTVVEERVVDAAGGWVVEGEESGDEEGGESTDEEESEGGDGKKKKGKKGKGVSVVDESSDEEYFDEKRCEWRSKEELKGKKGKVVAEERKKKEEM